MYRWLKAVKDYSLTKMLSYRSRLGEAFWIQVAGLPALYCQVLASLKREYGFEAYQVARSYYESILVRLDSLEDCRFKMRVYYRLESLWP